MIGHIETLLDSIFKLPCSQHSGQLNTGEKCPGSSKGLESQHEPGDLFDTTMVLYNQIMYILRLSNANGRIVLGIAADDRCRIGPTLVDIDDIRRAATLSGLGQKPLGGFLITLVGQQKINRFALLVYGPIQIHPQTLDTDIGLIKAPTDADGTLAPVENCLELRAIFDDPPINGRVVDVNTAFFEKVCPHGVCSTGRPDTSVRP